MFNVFGNKTKEAIAWERALERQQDAQCDRELDQLFATPKQSKPNVLDVAIQSRLDNFKAIAGKQQRDSMKQARKYGKL